MLHNQKSKNIHNLFSLKVFLLSKYLLELVTANNKSNPSLFPQPLSMMNLTHEIDDSWHSKMSTKFSHNITYFAGVKTHADQSSIHLHIPSSFHDLCIHSFGISCFSLTYLLHSCCCQNDLIHMMLFWWLIFCVRRMGCQNCHKTLHTAYHQSVKFRIC